MTRWSSTVGRCAVTLVTLLCVAAVAPMPAQQVAAPASQNDARATPATAAGVPLSGPRLRLEWRRAALGFEDGAPSGAVIASQGTTTITVTTLVLVLAVAIVVLLIA